MAWTYDLIDDYGANDLPVLTPYFIVAIFHLGAPISYSRSAAASVTSDVKTGVSPRSGITYCQDDVVSIQIHGDKRNHLKTASLRCLSSKNYLNPDIALPGDWIGVWLMNGPSQYANTMSRIESGDAANRAEDGFRFLGRIHDVRKSIHVSPEGAKDVSYSITASAFSELDSQIFYDFGLATLSGVKSDIVNFMSQLGLDWSNFAEQQQIRSGQIKDNADLVINKLIDVILGSGISETVNRPVERFLRAGESPTIDVLGETRDLGSLKISPQANKEAPYAYLVPAQIGKLLGLESGDASKSGLFGYADILQRIIGVQRYRDAYLPRLEKLKSTFLPVTPTFVNRPLWAILQQFLNPAINEIYTVMKQDHAGSIYPTVVVRQIPLSTEAVDEHSDFPLTRFMSLPRWVIDHKLITSLDLGRTDATRTNMVHIYGEAEAFANNDSVTNQIIRNPPIYDTIDIQRSGIRAQMSVVNCSITDQLKAPRYWMEAIADWSFGSHLTLNGSVSMKGVISPIVEGDNCQIGDFVFHVEAVDHVVSVAPNGIKSWNVQLSLSNGMPVQQNSDSPNYPGLIDDEASDIKTSDPGHASESDLRIPKKDHHH